MRRFIIAAVFITQIMPALANDSTAELKTGGLVFTKTPDIEMRSEELFVSTTSIVVKYHFFNRSSADISTLVAFPMPDIRDPGDGEDVAIPQSKDNFLGFETTVNGVSVPASLEQHAVSQGSDYTALLQGLGVPLMPYQDATANALDRLPHEKWADLVGKGLAALDDGDGTKQHLQARWTLKSTYTWQQVFPAGRELVVEHRYTPSVGGSVGTLLTTADTDNTDYIRRFCIDHTFTSAVLRAKKPGQDYPPFSEKRISYILKTGANWAAPIADFRLVVDKGDAKNLVSFCGDGVRKIAPTRFEMRKKNFLPDANLAVLILVSNAD